MIFPIFDITPAFAIPATLLFSEYSGTNEIKLVFDVPVDWTIGNFTGITHDFTTPSTPSVVSIAEISPSAIVTITFSGPPVFTDETGTIDIGAIPDLGSGNTFAGALLQPLDDGIPPTMKSLTLTSPTTINVNFSEDLDDLSVDPLDFSVSGHSVIAAEETHPGIVTLTLSSPVLDNIVVTLVGFVIDASISGISSVGSPSLVLAIISEGSAESIPVGAGGTGSFSYSETEITTTDIVSLAVTLPPAQAGTIRVATAVEDNLESDVNIATAADISGPYTGVCTIQFTVPNSILTAAGLTPATASIYHDSSNDGLLDSNEIIPTTRDTTTIPGSTVFTASASFTSAFGVGGKSGSAGASSSSGAAGNYVSDKCDSSAFGRGKSIQVYEISYELCAHEQLSVIAESYCGPARLSVLHAGGMTVGGLSMNQPYLDEHKILLNAPISQDYDKFRVLVENDKSYYDKLIIPQKLHGLVTECQKTITVTHDTGYLSNQTNSFSIIPTEPSFDNFTESQPTKNVSPRKIISIDDDIPLNDAFFEHKNDDAVQTTTLEYDPEPCVDTWDDSCLTVDPEPCVDTWNDSCMESEHHQDDDKLYFLSWFFDFFSK